MKSGRIPRAEKLLRVGLYDLEKTLGKGNFAIVKLGVHKLTRTKVAVKIVNKCELDHDNLNKISREIEIMRRLSHKNIIQLYQVMESDTFMYIITEYAANGEIFDWLVSNKRMSEKQAANTFSQILNAVNYCHKNSVVHRDLKAENLLLDHEGNIKLADFGFSNYYKAGACLDTWCGSPPYAAPELFEGRQYDGPRADIWSLGVMLYVLVSGSLPFDGQTLQDLRARIVACQYRIPFYLSRDCESLIRGLLVVDPNKRLSLAFIARHRWLVTNMETATHQRLLDDMEMVSEKTQPVVLSEIIMERVVELAGRESEGVSVATVKESLVENKCDDLAAMYHLLLYNNTVQVTQGSSVRGAEAGDMTRLTEVYTEADGGQGGAGGPVSRSGRRHTLGPANNSIPPLLQSPPQYSHLNKEILPQINLPQNLPFVSNKPFTDFSVKNQDLLRAPQSNIQMGRRASDCGVHYGALALENGHLVFKEAVEDSDSRSADDTNYEPSVFPVPEISISDRGAGGLHYLSRDKRPVTGPPASVSFSPDSPRKRRTGLMTVMEKPPDITDDVISDVESRIQQQRSVSPGAPFLTYPGLQDSPHSLSPLSPVSVLPAVTSPSHFSSSLTGGGARRGRQSCNRVSSLKEPHSLYLSNERYSPVRRLSEGAPVTRAGALPHTFSSFSSSTDQSPCTELQAIQDEYRQLNQETRLSIDSSSSGYHSPQYLCPPTPPVALLPDHPSLRRSSESNVILESSGEEEAQDQRDLMAAMYEDMYSTKDHSSSRRSSYPNSPSHAVGTRDKQILSQQFQKLCLQQRISESQGPEVASRGVRYKGSITQGVPSLAATTPTSPGLTPAHTPIHLMKQPPGPGCSSASAQSFDETFSQQINYTLFGSNYAPSADHFFQLPGDLSAQNPEISVTNVMGDEIKVVLTEPMDESS